MEVNNKNLEFGIISGNTAKLPPVFNRFTKEQFMEEVDKNFGIITVLCGKLDCTPRQLYNALDHWGLRDYLKDCKQQLVGVAEKTILDCMNSDNEAIKLRAAETTLKSLGKNEWSLGPLVLIQQQINVADEKAIVKQIFGIDE